VVYFPGSTIGNFHPREARSFLQHIAHVCGVGGGLLIGVDLKKDRSVLERAYNDSEGVTAAFNLNLLARLRSELGVDVNPEQFAHHAFYNEHAGRIEMHLISRRRQIVSIDDHSFRLEEGEAIHTENSYKYGLAEFAELAESAGLGVSQVWTDSEGLFSVQYLEVGS
jgi:dimethylhistidine N-methyltransferase